MRHISWTKVFFLLMVYWYFAAMFEAHKINHIQQVMHDQQAYIDNGCHGRYQGEEE